MRLADLFNFAWQVVRGSPARTLLILLAMGIGVAAVVVVTALGEGARLYVAMALLAVLGGTAGLLLGWETALALHIVLPALLVHTP